MTADGWQARLLAWALAILATLAIVGAVATMSTNGGNGGVTARDAETGIPASRDDPRTGQPVAPPAPFTSGAAREPAAVDAALRQADALRAVAGWLAALTYAVLALVAVAGAGVLVLLRIGQARTER